MIIIKRIHAVNKKIVTNVRTFPERLE